MIKTARILAFCFCLLFATTGKAEGFAFTVSPITETVKARIVGKSFPATAPTGIALSSLRYITVSYVDLQGERHTGEMIVNKAIANDVVEIFRELYNMRYPIERMELIDEYGANDERSMSANNSTAFCYRTVKGSKKLSAHARGMAIDLNPLYNPCFKVEDSAKGYRAGTLQPRNAARYVNRKANFPYKISQEVVRIFKKHGFRWGGDWRTKKDYQHFEK